MNKPCLDICIRPKIHDHAFVTLQSLQPVKALSKPTSSAERQSPRPKVPMTAHQVQVEGFWIDEHDVTNAEFAKFVTATGYVTTAEKKPDWDELRRFAYPERTNTLVLQKRCQIVLSSFGWPIET